MTSVEFKENEKILVLKHLEGISALYRAVNSSGDGPVGNLIRHIKSAPLIVEFNFGQMEKLLLHLKGAGKYDKVVYGSDPLQAIIEKLELALWGPERLL